MAYIILIIIALFLSLVNSLDLGWVLVRLVDLPTLYYHLFIWCVLVLRTGMYLWNRRWLFRSLMRRIYLWIDEEDQSGPGPRRNSGSGDGKVSGKRNFSTTADRLSPLNGKGGQRIPRDKGVFSKSSFERLKEKIQYQTRISSGPVVTVRKINATFSLKAKGLLLGAFERMLPSIRLRTTKYRIGTILTFINRAKAIHQHQGMVGLVNWLKANSVLLQQSLGGFKLRDLADLKCRPSRNAQGLPRLVLAQDRALIRAGNTKVMRFYLTLFNLYRVLEFPGKVKLGTITNPFSGSPSDSHIVSQLILYIPHFIKMWRILEGKAKVRGLLTRRITTPMIVKSGPGTGGDLTNSHPWMLALSAVNLKEQGLSGHVEYFMDLFRDPEERYPGLKAKFADACALPFNVIPSLQFETGKLGFKDEAAGKVRVFAMVDAWTQWSLEPFHTYIFDIIRQIPMDGTFDQMKPVLALAKTAKSAYSLDLSAATDRLPVFLQEKLFAELVNPEFASHWRALLTERNYVAFAPKRGIFEILKYAVGQPMGALSSWASLAFTHHFIVQCAAWYAGVVPVGTWFRNYAILGDDIVIFDPRVKRAYLLIIRSLGVECGTAKSVLSARGLVIEFAKRTLYKGIDISPIPLKEFVSANLTLSDAIQFARKYALSFAELLKSLGYGYRVRGSITRHVGRLNSRVRALLFAFAIPSSEEEVTELMFKGNPLISDEQVTQVLEALILMFTQQFESKLRTDLKRLPPPATANKAVTAECMEHVWTRLYLRSFLARHEVSSINSHKLIMGPFPHGLANKVMANEGFHGPVDIREVPRPDQAESQIGSISSSSLVRFNNSTAKPLFPLPPRKEIRSIYPEIIQVSPEVFQVFEEKFRDWNLVFTRLVGLSLPDVIADLRTVGLEALEEIYDLRFNRSLDTTYKHLIEVMRLVSRFSAGRITYQREEERLPWSSDPAQMRFWRMFTTCILKVLKAEKESLISGSGSSNKTDRNID